MLSDKVCRSNTSIHEQLCGCAHLCALLCKSNCCVLHQQTFPPQFPFFVVSHSHTHTMVLCGQFTAHPQECSCTLTTPHVDTNTDAVVSPLSYCPQLERFKKHLTYTIWKGNHKEWIWCEEENHSAGWMVIMTDRTLPGFLFWGEIPISSSVT